MKIITNYILRHYKEARNGGQVMLFRKLKRIIYFLTAPFFLVISIPIVFIIRIIQPFIYIRILELDSRRLGHFAGNTEMYLCEMENGIGIPPGKFVDLFYLQQPVCNNQLARMWSRNIIILPYFIMKPIDKLNNLFFGDCKYKIQSVVGWSNLLETSPIHLKFTNNEEIRGKKYLKKMGLDINSKFICLNVRDSAFLKHFFPGCNFDYHNYRDSDINNYVLAADELTKRGYFVIRMGAKVEKPLITKNPKIIDYACNGMRNDFMDVYLAAKCKFCISTSTGWDSLPLIFRRPIILVNYPEIKLLSTIQIDQLFIPKHFLSKENKKKLSLTEILLNNNELSIEYFKSNGIELQENSPEEICEVVIELDERLKKNWVSNDKDIILQHKFRKIIFSKELLNNNLYKIENNSAKIGTTFLKNNKIWAE